MLHKNEIVFLCENQRLTFTFFISTIFIFLLQPNTSFAQKDSLTFSETGVSLQAGFDSVYGTLVIPNHFTTGKTILIISGSGPTDRNGNSILLPKKNDCFLKMAHQLSKQGIASLRFDKRGVGSSKKAMKKEEDLTIDTLIQDVANWIDYLKKDGRFQEITVVGHSEGSLLGMIAAQNRADKFISISGTGFPADQILRKQLASAPGIRDSALLQINVILDSLRKGYLVKKYPLYLMSLFRASVQPYLISWFKYNPEKEIEKLKIPVLILQGDNDIQVTVEDAQQLHQGNPKSKMVIVPNMTHTLRICTSKDRNENMKTYQDSTMPLAEECIREMIGFIKQ